MSTEFEKALLELNSKFHNPRRKVELEVRLRYNKDTGEPLDKQHVNKLEVWEDAYIVVDDETEIRPASQRVIDGKLVKIDTATHVYWEATPAETLNNNPYFCIRETDADS